MLYFYVSCIFILFLQGHCVDFRPFLKEIDQMNVYCRDNNDVPVDWWYIYKPPQATGPYFETGLNFTYITSSQLGRFTASFTYINYNSMVQYSLAPLYKRLFKSNLAVMSYGQRANTYSDDDIPTSTALGVLFGNYLGGVWVSHTIPGFPDLTKYPPTISEDTFDKGHMMMCLTVDTGLLNAIAPVVAHTNVSYKKLYLPDNLRTVLPAWTQMETGNFDSRNKSKIKLLKFVTRSKTAQGVVLARAPNDGRCLYRTFAQMQKIVVDVYGSEFYKRRPICEATYSLRFIDSISLKFPERQVYYINNRTDKTTFGVSTAAVWQRSGQNIGQFWSCVGNIDRPEIFLPNGGLIICVRHYLIWAAFDNLKVKEPTC